MCKIFVHGWLIFFLTNNICSLQGEGTAISPFINFHSLSLTAVVVFAFVLCWLPFHVGRYLISKSTEMGSPLMSVISHYCNLISFVLFYLSAAINPILYNIMSKKYRMAACKLFGLHHTPRRSTSVVKGESSPCWTESTASLWLWQTDFTINSHFRPHLLLPPFCLIIVPQKSTRISHTFSDRSGSSLERFDSLTAIRPFQAQHFIRCLDIL